jgi:hypothetical protein
VKQIFTQKHYKTYFPLENNALIVPETDKTRTQAPIPAILVTVDKDALTMFKDARVTRITAT